MPEPLSAEDTETVHRLGIKLPSLKKNKEHEDKQETIQFDLTGGAAADNVTEGDAFEVSVRNSDPIIRRMEDESHGAAWIGDFKINLASAAVMIVMLGLLFISADEPMLTVFTFPGLLIFMLITSLETLGRDRIRLYAAAATAAILVALLIILRGYIAGGWANIINSLYDNAEAAQAYVYSRLNVSSTGEGHPERSMHIAAAWGSALLCLIAAIPHIGARRAVACMTAIFSMLAFAYYGLIPSAVCIAVLVAALVLVLARGHVLSVLPVLLLALLVFGAVTLIDPGENYGISRADENFRDRFALISAYLEAEDTGLDDLSGLEQELQDDIAADDGDHDADITADHGTLVTVAVIVLVLILLGVLGWRYWHRIQMRRAQNRADIDSKDPRQAIVAMFPYAVRWLMPAGIDAAGKTFDSLIPAIRADVSDQYADNYAGMYELWKEAAYSDHEMTEDDRTEMSTFLQGTIDMIKEQSGLRERLVNAIKYAL